MSNYNKFFCHRRETTRPCPQTLLTRGGSEAATCHLSGGWGGHRPMLTTMSEPAAGNGKEAMEPP